MEGLESAQLLGQLGVFLTYALRRPDDRLQRRVVEERDGEPAAAAYHYNPYRSL
jgi:hypothetical protein